MIFISFRGINCSANFDITSGGDLNFGKEKRRGREKNASQRTDSRITIASHTLVDVSIIHEYTIHISTWFTQ